MNIDKIITEEINRFIDEEVLVEKNKHHKSEKNKAISDILTGKKELKKGKVKKKDLASTKKNAKKLKNGLRTDFDAKKDKETNPNLNNQDSEDIANVIDSPLVNTAAVAHELRPDLTPEGAQSELRKKVKGLKSDSGSTYKLKKKEAFKLNRILSKYM